LRALFVFRLILSVRHIAACPAAKSPTLCSDLVSINL